MTEHQFECRCECGARWRVFRDDNDEDPTAECLSRGADTFDLIDTSEVRRAGRDMQT